MRWISLIALSACSELPPLPPAQVHADWTCTDQFYEAVQDCKAEGCPGLFAMQSLLDAQPMEFETEQVTGAVHMQDGLIHHVVVTGVTPYFYSQVTLADMDADPLDPATSRTVEPPDGDHTDRVASFEWRAWNSDEPMIAIGQIGLVRVEVPDEGFIITFLVVAVGTEHIVEGCAYVREPEIL